MTVFHPFGMHGDEVGGTGSGSHDARGGLMVLT